MNHAGDIDITVFGATGFTGKLVAEYLAQRDNDAPIVWAVAGRNADKLAAVRGEYRLGDEVDTIVADGDDLEALRALARRSKVVISAAGPYQLYGTKLVQACAEIGTDYVDLCGEPDWMRRMLDEHEATAAASGARIVFSCGFDSLPSDLGVLQLQNHAIEQTGTPVARVKGRVVEFRGEVSGGTVASMGASMGAAATDTVVRDLLLNPFALTSAGEGVAQPDGSKPVFDDDLGSWSTSFVMAVINTKNVHRSNSLLDHRYGEDFAYDEMLLTGPGEAGAAAADHLAASGGIDLSGDLPAPGEGPSKEVREAGGFTMSFSGEVGGVFTRSTVEGFLDPGYGCTSKMISESAICLLEDSIDISGGMWTPASAMGAPLLARMQRKGVLAFGIDT